MLVGESYIDAHTHTYAHKHAYTPLFVLCSIHLSLTLRYGHRELLQAVLLHLKCFWLFFPRWWTTVKKD